MTYAADGDVLTGNDSVNGNWTYTYDDFNRALTAVSNTGKGCSWDYDRYGNRWHQNTHSGTCLAPQYSFTGNNNRIDGASYDAAGNLLNDGVHNYLYDAENRIKSVDSATTYSYDAEDRRVAKTTGGATTDFIYDREGHIILTNPATPTLIEMYAAGLHLGTYQENAQHTDTIFYYDHGDWLGTERARVDLTGTVCETITSLPFGDNQVMSGSCVDVSPMHFTGKMRDTESNLDYFEARFYSSGLGRFLTADWAAKAIAVPYADFGDPQTLNLYGYGRNNPISFRDKNGHCVDGVSTAVCVIVVSAIVVSAAVALHSAYTALRALVVDDQKAADLAGKQLINDCVGAGKNCAGAQEKFQKAQVQPYVDGAKAAVALAGAADAVQGAAGAGINGATEAKPPSDAIDAVKGAVNEGAASAIESGNAQGGPQQQSPQGQDGQQQQQQQGQQQQQDQQQHQDQQPDKQPQLKSDEPETD